MADRLILAGVVVAIVLLVFVAAFVANMYGQIKAGQIYLVPVYVIHIISTVLGAAVAVLSWGGLSQIRKIGKKDSDNGTDDKNGR